MGITVNSDKLRASLKQLKTDVGTKATADALGRALEDARQSISARVSRRGVDVNEQRFAPYTPQYSKFRQKKGRNKKPDLTFTGQMLSSIQSRVVLSANKLLGLIFFSNVQAANKARGNQAKRKFFGLSKKDQAVLFRSFKTQLTKALKR